MTFGFVYLKKNKFEVSHSFVKSHLTRCHLLFNNQSKNILNVFYLNLIWNFFEMDMRMFCWKVLIVLTYLNSKVFMKKKLYILYLICNHNWKCLIHETILVFSLLAFEFILLHWQFFFLTTRTQPYKYYPL